MFTSRGWPEEGLVSDWRRCGRLTQVFLCLLSLLLLDLHHQVRHGKARVRGVAAEAHIRARTEGGESRLRFLRSAGR